jgi:hypothetical protein
MSYRAWHLWRRYMPLAIRYALPRCAPSSRLASVTHMLKAGTILLRLCVPQLRMLLHALTTSASCLTCQRKTCADHLPVRALNSRLCETGGCSQ